MIVFRSEVGPDVMMFDAVAQRMMELMGKEKADRGVVTVEQLPQAIALLRAAAEQDRALHRGTEAADDGDENAAPPPVGLSQRIVPLVELLEISLARKTPVLWGV
ncbi:MAG: DUF1840 domain-containing protein [Rhodocyclaceae bacterium]|jgi:hypothetical protein|nr:DUF1840 domain-containing protein [Rhodocyclaceae bacterium]